MALTTNVNFLQPTGFKLIVNREHYPNLDFFCQSVQHGSVTVPQADLSYSRIRLKEPGDTIQYADVTFDILLDENLEVYKEIHKWLVDTVQTNKQGGIPTEAPLVTSVSLVVLNSHSNPSSTITYHRAYPIDMGTMNLTSNAGALQFITLPVTFVYDYFEIT